MKNENMIWRAEVALAFALVVFGFWAPEALAGQGGTEFKAVTTKLQGMLEGGGGTLAAILGLAGGAIACVGGFDMRKLIGGLGIGAAAGFGVPIVTGSVTAII